MESRKAVMAIIVWKITDFAGGAQRAAARIRWLCIRRMGILCRERARMAALSLMTRRRT